MTTMESDSTHSHDFYSVNEERSEFGFNSVSTTNDDSVEKKEHDSDVYHESERSSILPEQSYAPRHTPLSMRRSIIEPCTFQNASESPICPEQSDSPVHTSVSMSMSIDQPLLFQNASNSGIQFEGPNSATSTERVSVKITERQTEHDSRYDPASNRTNAKNKYKSFLRNKFKWLNEKSINSGDQVILNEIFIELYLKKGGSSEVNNEHEVRQLEAAHSRRTAEEDTLLKISDIFNLLSEQDKPIRTVLLKGVTGAGKSISVQKFVLDWAEDKANQDVDLIFPLPFRELNLMKEQMWSLKELLCACSENIKNIKITRLGKIMFVFDGLDEWRFSLDFQNTRRLCDVNEPASVEELLINLIRGNLLPSALIWITSRPAAADQIPREWINRVTELRGFSDLQKEEYFRKRISDSRLSNKIITHIKSLRSLHIMCHIPLFCWVSATVLERLMDTAESGEIPKTLTEMFTHFLIIQTDIIREKYTKTADTETIIKLAQLAFMQLMEGNLIFYEEDLTKCGIELTEAVVRSGVCTQILKEQSIIFQRKVFCFVHLSLQEYLAALYVHLTFINNHKNVLRQSLLSNVEKIMRKDIKISDIHKAAIDQALQSTSGHLDLFTRFLLGLSHDPSKTFSQSFVPQTLGILYDIKETVTYIKKLIKTNPETEKLINLFYSLYELHDESLVQEIQQSLRSKGLHKGKLSQSEWSAVMFVLLTSEQTEDTFTLNEYIDINPKSDFSTSLTSDQVLQKLLPVVAASRTSMLNDSELTERSCTPLASLLISETSRLRTLSLSGNKISDSGVKLLANGLKNHQCKLETLKLCDCGITDAGCAFLASFLKLNPSHLKKLHLSVNNFGNVGLKLLSDEMRNLDCKLETLSVKYCGVSAEGCEALAVAIKSNPSHLKELSLNGNNLQDEGVKHLSAGLENPHCNISSLSLWDCGISDAGCAALASALTSNPSHLRILDLSRNKLRDAGAKHLAAVLKNPDFKLEHLSLQHCDISKNGCTALLLVLNSSHLKELNLTGNQTGDCSTAGDSELSSLVIQARCRIVGLNQNLTLK